MSRLHPINGVSIRSEATRELSPLVPLDHVGGSSIGVVARNTTTKASLVCRVASDIIIFSLSSMLIESSYWGH